MRYGPGRVLWVVLLAGCATLPSDEEAKTDAIGCATVSTPIFVPINSAVEGDRRLDLRELRKESRLYELINESNISIKQLGYEPTRIALAAGIADWQTSVVEEAGRTGSNAASGKTGEELAIEIGLVPGSHEARSGPQPAR